MNSSFLFIGIFIWLSFLMSLLILFNTNEGYYNNSIYNHSTKCFSCERDIINRYGPEWGWLGQDTKSFDAEKDLILRTGFIDSAFNAHDVRYY